MIYIQPLFLNSNYIPQRERERDVLVDSNSESKSLHVIDDSMIEIISIRLVDQVVSEIPHLIKRTISDNYVKRFSSYIYIHRLIEKLSNKHNTLFSFLVFLCASNERERVGVYI